MRIEHVAYTVADPPAVAGWYAGHLGMRIASSGGEPTFTHFLADDAGTMLEIYNNPAVAVPDYASMDPLLLHVAFASDDVRGDSERLQAAGATFVEEVGPTGAGDHLIMLRDPWGLAIQLAKRGHPMG